MFDMWSSVTSKLDAHNNTSPVQTNVQANVNGQAQSSGSIKGKIIIYFFLFKICNP